MTGQRTLDKEYNLLGELDPEPGKILAEALLKIGLDQGYCHTHRWYNIKASFYILDNTNVRINNPIVVEREGP